ncbi:nuclear transport factor 2 family protein [Streptomyces sp. NPDC005562]|uniref:nuclear transport factor 2 family protein n=1 Tax=unclassified Streptomyces TaxID=2593676 RepID=UPI0033B3301B
MTAAKTDVEQVELANTAFYEALERGDFDAVSDLWLDSNTETDGTASTSETADDNVLADTVDGGTAETTSGDTVSCVHPGWPVLRGRGEVLRSYALIMANTEYIQFFLTDLKVGVAGDTALVTCTENILSGGPPPEAGGELGPLVGQLVVATNLFRRTPDGWKLWSHHASPVLAETDDEEDDEPPS